MEAPNQNHVSIAYLRGIVATALCAHATSMCILVTMKKSEEV